MSLSIQTRFADALTSPERPVPDGLIAWNGDRPERRFAVYRNNVSRGLIEALRTRFPACDRIVGPAFFEAMAAAYIAVEPPRSPVLLSYGEGFADFIAGFEPAADLAYLPDVARLEAARSRAYHARDAAPLEAEALAAIDPAALAGLVFEPHPSLTLLRSAHPVVTIWAMNADEMPLRAIDPTIGEDALVVRPAMRVHVHRLPPGGAVFLEALRSGRPLGEAVESAAQSDARFDLVINLAGVIDTGAFIAIR